MSEIQHTPQPGPVDQIDAAFDASRLPEAWRGLARRATVLFAAVNHEAGAAAVAPSEVGPAMARFFAWVAAGDDVSTRFVRLNIGPASFWMEFIGAPQPPGLQRRLRLPPGWSVSHEKPQPTHAAALDEEARVLRRHLLGGGQLSAENVTALSDRLGWAIVVARRDDGLWERCLRVVSRAVAFRDKDEAPLLAQPDGLRPGLSRQETARGCRQDCASRLADHLVDRARRWYHLDRLGIPAALRLDVTEDWCVSLRRRGGEGGVRRASSAHAAPEKPPSATEAMAARLLEQPSLARHITCPTQRAVYALVQYVRQDYNESDCAVVRTFDEANVFSTLDEWFSAAAAKYNANVLADWLPTAFTPDDVTRVRNAEGPQAGGRPPNWAKSKIQLAREAVREALQLNPVPASATLIASPEGPRLVSVVDVGTQGNLK